jgi:mRNA interferase RelE/StbE
VTQGRLAVVRLTDAAMEDLRNLLKKDPQIVRWCLKKMLLLERSPMAGEALVGGLIGFRKLVVGDRDWRIVWRVLTDSAGTVTVDVAEVWAAGARADSEVYEEMRSRVAALGDSPKATALTDVVQTMGRLFTDIEPTPEPLATEPVPSWLADRLVRIVGLSPDDVAGMTPEEAITRLEAHWVAPHE